MADLTAGGVPVYRDSAGALREVGAGSGASGQAGAPGPASAPLAMVQLTDSSLTTVYMLAGIPAGAKRIVLESNGTAGVRWTDTGTNPAPQAGSTPGIGRRITSDRPLDYTGDLSKLRLIGEAPGAILDGVIYG